MIIALAGVFEDTPGIRLVDGILGLALLVGLAVLAIKLAQILFEE